MANPKKYLEHLFISKVRIKALKYFFMHDEAIHLRAAVRELNEEINAVRRELARMEEIGLLIAEKRGNKKYFRVNRSFLFYDELSAIVHKSFGLGGEIVNAQKKLGEIKFALVTQGFTRRVPYGSHQIDLMIVGERIDMHELEMIVHKEEQKLGREIPYTVLSGRDFDLHKQRKDKFIIELLVQDLTMLVGDRLEFIKLDD